MIWLGCLSDVPWKPKRNPLRCAAVMSSNGETSVVLRGVTHGAVDFLIKPVRVEELRNVWQHVVRRRKDKVRCSEHSAEVLKTACLLESQPHKWQVAVGVRTELAEFMLAASSDGEMLCWAQELQPSKESDEEGTDDGKQRDKKRKEVGTVRAEVFSGTHDMLLLQ